MDKGVSVPLRSLGGGPGLGLCRQSVHLVERDRGFEESEPAEAGVPSSQTGGIRLGNSVCKQVFWPEVPFWLLPRYTEELGVEDGLRARGPAYSRDARCLDQRGLNHRSHGS